MTGPAGATGTGGRLAFLFTDIEGSTQLWERDAVAMQAALGRHDALVREGVERLGGQVFKTAGDAFYAVFTQPGQALAAAVSLQRALFAEAWPTALPIRVRMALHEGEAQWRQGDYFGPPLNVVARMLSVGRGGQALASAAVIAAAASLPAGARVERHGHFRMKGVAAPVEVCELGVEGMSAFAPPTDTDSVYRVVRVADLWQPVRAIRHNLPGERDAFVGRTRELHALAQRLESGSRLVTVLGPGGAGKTRFARRYASAWLGDWPGGVTFCDLSEARSLQGLASAVAVALDVPLAQDDAVVQVGHAIAGRGRCLVVLDNFEHLVQHAEATLGRWAERAADAVFLVTSRERLRLVGEESFALEPLDVDSEAVDLFVARARAQRPDFALNAANRDDVGRIVRLLDGLPLAIELAAARVRVLSPAQLVERMRDRFALLAGARGDVARQATLRAAIDWSWDLLVTWEQAALAQCAVFEGGFTLELAEQVIDLAAWPDAPPVMDAVQALVDKSLLRTWVPAGDARFDLDELYFGMYVSIHEYAGERLRAMGPDAERIAEARHGRCFARFGEDAAIEALYGNEGTLRHRALALEFDNVVAACRRAVARGDPSTAILTYRAAWEVLDMRGPFQLAAELGAHVLGLDGLDETQRGRAMLIRARTLQRSGKSGQARELLDQALALALRSGDARLEAPARANLGALLVRQGRMDEGRGHLDAALALYRAQGNRRAEGNVLTHLGRFHIDTGEVDEGRRRYAEALALQRALGNRVEEASLLSQMAVTLGETGNLPEAREHFEQTLAISRELGDRIAEGEALNNLGCLHQDLGRLDDARALFESALAIHREVGNRIFEGYALGDLGRLHLEQGRFGEARACIEQALVIMRETADRRIEGSELRSLGELFLAQGDLDQARERFAQAEAVLREVDDKLYLALVLCGRGEVQLRSGDAGGAQSMLAEACRLAAETGMGPASMLGRRIAALAAQFV